MPPRSAGTRPTLSLVAQTAGTSVPTVSKVLRGGTDVSAETRVKVMDAVQAVGYTRKAGGKVESSSDETLSSNVLDLVVTHFEGSWANLVLAGIGNEAAAAGLDVVLTLAQPETDWASRILRRRSVGTIGVLLDPTTRQFNALSAAGIPLVLIEPMRTPPTTAAGIQRIGASAGEDQQEEGKAVQYRQLASVGDREEAVWQVLGEVCERHLAACNERRRPREQAGNDQHAGD